MSKTGWTPPPGRHEVQVGASLSRMLRARKGITQKRSNNIPDKEFFAMRYNFKPSSVDSTKPATLTKNAGSKLTVEHPSTNSDEVHVFLGEEVLAKDWLCVLVYDEHTGGYTLEKVESSIALNLERRSSNKPATAGAGPSKSRQEDNAPVVTEPPRREEEEESEEEIPLQQTVVEPKPQKVTPPPPPPPVKPSPVRASPIKPTKSERPSAKREPEPVSDAEEEVWEFGHAPKRVKRTPPTPDIDPVSILELPGQSSSYAQPLPAPSAPSNAYESEEEDWDEIPPQAPAAVDGGEGEGEGEEIDLDEFADLMNQHLVEEEEEDFLLAAVSPEPESRPTGPIMSLRQMAGGDVSEDEYSSSEDSDDD